MKGAIKLKYLYAAQNYIMCELEDRMDTIGVASVVIDQAHVLVTLYDYPDGFENMYHIKIMVKKAATLEEDIENIIDKYHNSEDKEVHRFKRVEPKRKMKGDELEEVLRECLECTNKVYEISLRMAMRIVNLESAIKQKDKLLEEQEEKS